MHESSSPRISLKKQKENTHNRPDTMRLLSSIAAFVLGSILVYCKMSSEEKEKKRREAAAGSKILNIKLTPAPDQKNGGDVAKTPKTQQEDLDIHRNFNNQLLFDGNSFLKHPNKEISIPQIFPCTKTITGATVGTRKKGLEMLKGPMGSYMKSCDIWNIIYVLEGIVSEITDQDLNVRWDDFAGLDHAKRSVTEMIIWPLMRPDIFKGCRNPGRGLLLFGPPGTGKTMVGKAIAEGVKATFFLVSASTFASKRV